MFLDVGVISSRIQGVGVGGDDHIVRFLIHQIDELIEIILPSNSGLKTLGGDGSADSKDIRSESVC